MTTLRLGLLALLAAAVLAVGSEAPQRPARPKTLEEQAAEDLLERFRREHVVKQQLLRQTAAQHFRTGVAHFELRAWEPARRQFEQALSLAPSHKEAQSYLARTRGLLGLQDGNVQAAIGDYVKQRGVALQLQRIQLLNLFEQGKAQYESAQYDEAAETFTRARAQAQYLAPRLDTSAIARESAARALRARNAAEQAGRDAERQKHERAQEDAERLNQERRRLDQSRYDALFRQAEALYVGGRYEDARIACDALLLNDPAQGAAEALRAKAIQAGRGRDIQRTLARREAEEAHHMRQVDSWRVPQAALVHLTPEARNAAMSRSAQAVYGRESEVRPAWEAGIRAALQRPVSFDFIETPLSDVLGFLGQLTGVTIVLDTESVRARQPTVTLRVTEMRLEAALGWICKLTGLKYGLRNEAVFVSSPDRFGDRVALRMYDVSDLTLDIPDFKGNHKALSTGEGHGRDGGETSFENFFDDDEDNGEDAPLTGAELIRFIRRVFASEPWDDVEEDEFSGLLGDPAFTIRQKDPERLDGKALVDIIGITVGGRTFLAARAAD